MAMIKCPECGKDISDKAKSCPNCGYPLPFQSQQQPFPQYPYQSQPVQSQIVVHDNLNSSNTEGSLLVCKPSIDAYAGPITLFLIGITCLKLWSLLTVIFIVIAILMAVSISTTNLSISANGIHGEIGFGDKKSISTPISAVSSVQVEHGIFGQSSGYGTITITCAEGVFIFKSMKNAEEFKQIFIKLRGALDWH